MTRISDGLKRAAEAQATPYSRAVAAYGLKRGDARLGIGCKPNDAAAYLKHKITGGQLATDKDLAALLPLANDTEMAALRQDPLTAQRIDEHLRGE